MGHLNMRTLVDRLQRLGIASRADLAKSLNMSAPTAGKIADVLLSLGVIEEIDNDRLARLNGTSSTLTRLGRPGRMLRLDRSTPRFLGIELGASNTSLALLPVGLEREDRWMHQFQTPASAAEWKDRLKSAATHIERGDSWGVLVSVPGIVDEQAGKVLFSANLRWTEKADIPALIKQVWDAPVVLVQEERALALGQQYVDPKVDDFLLVDVGEGVGGAAVVSGRLYATPLSISGELGHTPVLGNRRMCGCGAMGCVETLLSTRGLVKSFAEATSHSDATWADLVGQVRAEGVALWLTETLNAGAAIIAGALNVLGLRRVIITGGLTELDPIVMEHLSAAILRGTMWARFGRVEIESAPRRRMAGLVAVAIDRLVLPRVALRKSAADAAHSAVEAY